MYKKSHGLTKPGQQEDREYNWPFDKSQHRFGKGGVKENGEVLKCLQPDRNDRNKNFNYDPIALPKNLGQTGQLYDKNMVFGKNPRKPDPWDVAQCIRGEATYNENYFDPLLGRSAKNGNKNIPKRGDENRVFGVPSVRFDIEKPKANSLANDVNFGDDPSAIELMFPHCYTHYGLTEDDITMLRGKEEIRDIFKSIGIEYKAGKFEGVWMRA